MITYVWQGDVIMNDYRGDKISDNFTLNKLTHSMLASRRSIDRCSSFLHLILSRLEIILHTNDNIFL